MTLKVAVSPIFKQKVIVELQNERGGVDSMSFMATYNRLPTDEFKRLTDDVQVSGADLNEIVKRVLAGWSDVIGDDGRQFEFTAENLEYLLAELPQFATAVVVTFIKSHEQGKRKN